MNAIQQINQLRELIRRHDQSYHGEDSPTISDQEYDSLVTELRRLEEAHPQLADPNSPTQGTTPIMSPALAQVPHPVPMMSLRTVTSASESDIRALLQKLTTVDGNAQKAVAELKYDGLSLELTYLSGRLTCACTRGDHYTGEDVTLVATAAQIPSRLHGNPPAMLTVRGEAFLSFSDFAEINRRLSDAGETPKANVRNAAAGAMRRNVPDAIIAPRIQFVAYEWTVSSPEQPSPTSHAQAMAWLGSFGLRSAAERSLVSESAEHLEAFCREVLASRETLDVPIDGVVIKADSLAVRQSLGVVGKDYNWAIAYKFPSQHAATDVLDIQLQVGRTGLITPVAILSPVRLGGTTVTRANLFSQGKMEELGVSIGSRVLIQRGGDTIPAVVRALHEPFPPIRPSFDQCPSCAGPLTRVKNQYFCCATQSCPGQAQSFFTRFVSRSCADVDGIGPGLVHQLIQQGHLKTLTDLYTLGVRRDAVRAGCTYEEHVWHYSLADLYISCHSTLAEVMGSYIRAQKLTIAIYRSLVMDLGRFIACLGVRGVGEVSARQLATHCVSLKRFMELTPSEVVTLPFLDVVAQQGLMAWLANPSNHVFVKILAHAGLKVSEWAVPDQPLAGTRIAMTGAFDQSRDVCKARLVRLGAQVTDSPRGADFFMVGDRPTQHKVETARRLNKTIIAGSPAVFEEMLNTILMWKQGDQRAA